MIAIYFSIGCLFIPIGAKCLLTSRSVRPRPRARFEPPPRARAALSGARHPAQVVEVSQQYDGTCKPFYQTNALCTISLTVPRTMNPPVFVYYELNNAYFNHRRMVLSRSDAQLRGDDTISADLLKTCAPQEYQGNGARCCDSLSNACGCSAALQPMADALEPRLAKCREPADQPVRPDGVVVLQRLVHHHAAVHRVRSARRLLRTPVVADSTRAMSRAVRR